MARFGRRRQAAVEASPSPHAAEAAALGWQAVGSDVIDDRVRQIVHRAARVLHGGLGNVLGRDQGSADTRYDEVFRTSVDGRAVFVANLSTNVAFRLPGAPAEDGAAVCIVEVPSSIAVSCIQPRRLQPVDPILPELATGNPTFDERYRVQVRPGFGAAEVTDEMQRLVLARDDWVFANEHTFIVSVAKGAFTSVSDMRGRIDDVLAFVAAIPTTMLAAEVDHSNDDLVARINRLDTLDDTLAFLQTITPADRARLAESKTPLARFADVQTPDEAFARFEQLSTQEQMQVLSMFRDADD